VTTTSGDVRWLTADEQRSWRAWITAACLLQERLERDLKSSHGLSMAEYEVLVRLSEAPERRLRMTDLATRTLASKSRLSHQVARMEANGLVRREECLQDRRGSYAVLTDAGWRTLVEAAPAHVGSVRRWLVDPLSEQDLSALGRVCERVVDAIRSDEDRPA
jgi:DNA-binding MarR family transcriptional regulator